MGGQLKIGVKDNGFYRLTRQELENSGLVMTGVDPKKIKIGYRGKEIPIRVSGESDGAFDVNDVIEFYGQGISRDSSEFEFTETNIYWLSAGNHDALRMQEKDGTPGSNGPPDSFQTTVYVEQDTFYTQVIPNGEGKDHWFWGGLIRATESRSFPFTIKNNSTAKKGCTFRYYLQGKTDMVQNPDHHTRVYLNGILVDDQRWDGFSQFINSVNLPNCNLINGNNTVRLDSVGDTGAVVDSFLFNWFEIDYWDQYVAENNVLFFNGVGASPVDFSVMGFTQNDINVFDISDPLNPARIINHRVDPVGTSTTVSFQDNFQGQRNYVALTSSQFDTPSNLFQDNPSTLKDLQNGADYIIIAHESFLNSVNPLADHRRSRGLRVVTVDVMDIYDEFGFGMENPQAIKDFIKFAFENWQRPAPMYVLLVGDATLDYKDNLKRGFKNLVPSHLVETAFIQTSSDNWFVSVSGDDSIPDLFIGRISVKTPGQADAVVNKILAYEKALPTGWVNRVQFVADNPDAGGDFEAASEDLIQLLPGNISPLRVYQTQVGSGAQTAIRNNINNGVLVTNYTGHGSVSLWAHMFSSSAVSSLSNAGKPTFVVTLNCLNGFFNDPYEGGVDPLGNAHGIPLAEAFVNAPNKGAIAAWSPTGLGFTFEHDLMAQELFDAIFNQGNHILGSVTTQAKVSAYSKFGISVDNLETFVLFGDPAGNLSAP
jgi:hypothetical protein